MNNKQKEFNLYVFLSTFARNLIEVFIPIILYKYGYSLKEVILYYLLVNIFSLVLSYPCVKFSKKFGYRNLAIIGILAFTIMQILLNKIAHNLLYISLISFMFALYRRGYWVSRRYFNLKVIKKDNIAKNYTLVSIVNHIGVTTSAYIGALLLDFVNIKVLTIISISLFFLSTIPLFRLENSYNKNNDKLDLYKTFKKIPKADLYLFATYELINVVKFLFSLYLFIYIKNNYSTIGVLNLFTNIATIIYAYTYGKKINNSKKDYIKASIILCVITYFLKANLESILLMIISFIEGFVIKMYEISINKEIYTLSKKFEYENYNLLYELAQNMARTIVVMLLYLLTNDLKTMIYITLLFIFFGITLKFKSIRGRDYKLKETNNN